MKNLRKIRSFWTLNIWTTFLLLTNWWDNHLNGQSLFRGWRQPRFEVRTWYLAKNGWVRLLEEKTLKIISGKSNGQSTSWGEWWKIPLAGLELSDILIDPEVWNLLQVPKISGKFLQVQVTAVLPVEKAMVSQWSWLDNPPFPHRIFLLAPHFWR